uniref:Uncharacterized protein n=1 Tax=Oryza rufipogon TaxID=4529 RepID=A0A0E0QPS3_ORYRU
MDLFPSCPPPLCPVLRFSHPFTYTNIFGNWLRGVSRSIKKMILIGASAFIFMSSYWLHFWSTVLPQEEQDTMRNGATFLELVAKGLLFHYGWRSSIRIAS